MGQVKINQTSNLTYISSANNTYVIRDNDDTINVHTNSGATILKLQNISGSGLQLNPRVIYINDVDGSASTNNITILCNGSDTINGASSLVISNNNGSVAIQISSFNEWIATGSGASSPALPSFIQYNIQHKTLWDSGSANNTTNTTYGYEALTSVSAGGFSSAYGFYALNQSQGAGNTGIGGLALASNISGNSNTAVGAYSLLNNAFGNYNTAIGSSSLISNIDGNYNTSIGESSLVFNTYGSQNIGVGNNSLFNNTTGYQNISIGNNTLYNNTIGQSNVGIGYGALNANTNGGENVAIGTNSLAYSLNGYDNTAVGTNSLFSNTNGSSNTAFGAYSLSSNLSGIKNIGIGAGALNDNTTGEGNISLGFYTQSGDYNYSIILGYQATATENNQFVVGSSIQNAGSVVTAAAAQTKYWNVIINGVPQRILLA